MNTQTIRKANSILNHIVELEDFIIGKTNPEWAYESGVEPHRAAMLQAMKQAQAAARAVMEVAARRQIEEMQQQLKAMGIE